MCCTVHAVLGMLYSCCTGHTVLGMLYCACCTGYAVLMLYSCCTGYAVLGILYCVCCTVHAVLMLYSCCTGYAVLGILSPQWTHLIDLNCYTTHLVLPRLQVPSMPIGKAFPQRNPLCGWTSTTSNRQVSFTLRQGVEGGWGELLLYILILPSPPPGP